MIFSEDMRDLARLFNRHGVSYAVCGGFAVAHYGFVRMTLDFDLLIDPAPDNARRVMAALDEFGFGGAGITLETLALPSAAITLGVQPNQIDLLTRMSSTNTAELIGRAVAAEIDGVPVRVVSMDDLIAAKREAGRPKDLADVSELDRLRRPGRVEPNRR